jgi:hypothetical protein
MIIVVNRRNKEAIKVLSQKNQTDRRLKMKRMEFETLHCHYD